MTITKQDIHNTIKKWPSLYEDQSGNRFIGEAVSSLPSKLRNARCRGISRAFADEYFLRSLGCEIRKAQYVGGGRPTGKFVYVVFVEPFTK